MASLSSGASYCLASPSRSGVTLRTEFARVGDRFVNEIVGVTAAGQAVAVWQEVQPSESDDWPASPPIQELSLETIDGKDVLLGVGRAGRSHWSVSVEATEVDGHPAMRFDYACRCPDSPQWLGTTYQVASQADSDRAAAPALRVVCADQTDVKQIELNRIVIEPIGHPQKWPGTVRWCYTIYCK